MAIAIAGSGPVGKTIIEAFLENSKYKSELILLTRKYQETSPLDQIQQIPVNYSDVAALAAQLEEHNVHTVVCAIGILTQEASQAQINLIQAADLSTTTKRFIPSEYSYIQSEEIRHISPDAVQLFIDGTRAIESSNLQYTRVIPGFFMDYWGMPNIRTNMVPFTYAIDILNARAIIPGDGNNVITMTYTYDMARFIVKLLDLEEWPEFSFIGGDDITFNQLLDIAQELRGTKFDVTYDSLDRVRNNEATPLPQPEGFDYGPEFNKWVTGYMSHVITNDGIKLPKENRLNDIFPDIHPISMKEFLIKAWKRD
ncbi:hypothetical protein N7462_005295 [Penicillium macrosclerotiorum]|uniref:uncharacterized protein n=1 Tax=Penicillium macrosclerotiorum TaxID=303699 RepID=UPI002546ED1C|nr:uncharacterized protein N7462_005295 [Penicillium macrosclerotiorum]KAJ5690903.1 hypothetical protein N7462_005295 [Penicillium macrosclerotiorum]